MRRRALVVTVTGLGVAAVVAALGVATLGSSDADEPSGAVESRAPVVLGAASPASPEDCEGMGIEFTAPDMSIRCVSEPPVPGSELEPIPQPKRPDHTTIDPGRIQPTLPEGTDDGGGQPFDIDSQPACIQVSDHLGAMRGCVDRDALYASPLEEPPWSQLVVTDDAGEVTGVFFRGLLGFVPIDVAGDPAKVELLDSCVESLLALRVIDAVCDASLREGSYR